MAKFNPTITAYLVPYIGEGYDNKKIVMDESDMYTCPQASVYISGKALVPTV